MYVTKQNRKRKPHGSLDKQEIFLSVVTIRHMYTVYNK